MGHGYSPDARFDSGKLPQNHKIIRPVSHVCESARVCVVTASTSKEFQPLCMVQRNVCSRWHKVLLYPKPSIIRVLIIYWTRRTKMCTAVFMHCTSIRRLLAVLHKNFYVDIYHLFFLLNVGVVTGNKWWGFESELDLNPGIFCPCLWNLMTWQSSQRLNTFQWSVWIHRPSLWLIHASEWRYATLSGSDQWSQNRWWWRSHTYSSDNCLCRWRPGFSCYAVGPQVWRAELGSMNHNFFSLEVSDYIFILCHLFFTLA